MPGDLDSPARLARLGRLTNDPKNAAARIFVGNTTPSNSLDIDLRDIFSRFGEIIGVSVHKQGTYAFVQFTAEEEAQAAIRGAGELSLAGKRIGEFTKNWVHESGNDTNARLTYERN